MKNMALYWKRHEMPSAPGLADYGGDPNNFLECVPTYVHAVPFLNAANVGMMRSVAQWCAWRGDRACADNFTGDFCMPSMCALILLFSDGDAERGASSAAIQQVVLASRM